MSHLLADVSSASPVRTVAEAGTYIARVCFKHGPPRLTGIELEWLLADPAEPDRRPDLATLRIALGPHAPCTLTPDSPAAPLPAGGTVTVEPGGQVEISSIPARSCAELVAAMRTDVAALTALLAPTGFVLADAACDPARAPHRLLRTPRYDAMAAGFERISPAGATMMCATAATQLCVDLGDRDEAATRWQAAHLLGPVLLAAFANSPTDDRLSGRMAAWWELDPARTCPPGSLEPGDYVERVLDTEVLARRRLGGDWLPERPMTLRGWIESGDTVLTSDLDLHLSMLFPPVRPQGYLELRYLDAQPAGEWIAPLALVAALFGSRGTLARATEVCRPAADRWWQATSIGLDDPVLAGCARQLAELATAALPGAGLDDADSALVQAILERRLREGICPARDSRPVGAPPPAAVAAGQEGGARP
ncbi:MAG TPA: glutamate-cysteine ligase family protein [Jatrophihabitans sp.]|nr:glutamate-cysteine ligase family protein [Jatrophihabitans sp.]